MSTYRYLALINMLDKILLIGTLLVAVIVIFFSRYKNSEFFVLLSLICFTSILFIINRDSFILVIVILGLAFVEVASIKIVKKIFIYSVVSTLFVLCSFGLGLISQYIMYRDGVTRYSLGFYHPNTVGIVFFILLSEYFFFRNKNLKVIDFLVSTCITFVIFSLTNSRTTLIVTMLLILGMLFVRYFNFNRIHRILKVCVCLPMLNFILSLAAVDVFPNNNIIYKINQLLSGRIYFGRLFIDLYGIRLFGNDNVEIIGTKQVSESYGTTKAMILDNSYLLALVKNGIIPLVFLLILYTILIWSVLKKREYYFLIILICFLVLGITESFMFNYHYNIFLLFIFTPIIYKKQIEKYESTDCIDVSQ